MPKFVIAPGINKLSVTLQIDLSDYCKACMRLQLAQRPADKQDEVTTKSDIAETSHWKERDALAQSLHGLPGELHWMTIKNLLRMQCDRDSPIENQLATALSGTENTSLVIQALNNSFVELLKNSIDAMTKRYLTFLDIEQSTQLQISVTLSLLSSNKIYVLISDNAGGFPQDYLGYFTSTIEDNRYKENFLVSEKNRGNNYFFGGAGLGLQQLCRLLLDGEIQIDSAGQYINICIVPRDSTSIAIRNNADLGGAEIHLTSPLTAFHAIVEPQSTVASPRPFLTGEIPQKKH